MKYLQYIIVFVLLTGFSSCSFYNFTGTGRIDAKTFQVNFFQDSAPLIEPGIERRFTQRIKTKKPMILKNPLAFSMIMMEMCNWLVQN